MVLNVIIADACVHGEGCGIWWLAQTWQMKQAEFRQADYCD